jgi:predicted aspartyl protease
MGTFSVKMRVWNPAQSGSGGVEEYDAFVDTGAAFSWISRARLQRLGVLPSRKMSFRTIELLERGMATVYVSTDKYSVPDVVVMAEEGEMEVMGAHTIEGLGMAADPVQKKLVPTVMLALRASQD